MRGQVLIRCDAGPTLGSGHVMRCLALARALTERGTAVTFASTAQTFETVPTLAVSQYPSIALERPLDTDEIAARGPTWDAVVVDHYALDARHEAALRRVAPVVAVIDDLADRAHDCDVLCDQTIGRTDADYAPLVPSTAAVYLGADYALLQPAFAQNRPAALAARAERRPVSRVLISLGMTDIGGITAWATKAALASDLDAEFAVAVGSRAPSMPALKALAASDRRVVLYPDCEDMCALMVASDLAIGAGGMTSWERCCLGLPAIVLVLAENQARNARHLARLGAVELLPERDPSALAAAIRRLAANADARAEMSRAAAALTDGKGAQRLADILTSRIPPPVRPKPRGSE